jgi:hypothetical protein
MLAKFGCWTFLTHCIDESDIETMELQLDGHRYVPVTIQRTSPYSRLWTFEFPPSSTARVAQVSVRDQDGTATEYPISVIENRSEYTSGPHWEGSIGVISDQGLLGYEPGAEQRTVQELDPEPDLLAALQLLGIASVRKLQFAEDETPPADRRDSRGRPAPTAVPRLWRAYYFDFDPAHCEQAIAEIVRGLDGIEGVIVSSLYRQFAAFGRWQANELTHPKRGRANSN